MDQINKKYLDWVLLNPKWLPVGIGKRKIMSIKDEILNDGNLMADLKKIYKEEFKMEPEELLLKDRPRFYYFIRTFMSDIKWKIKYEGYSKTLNKENENKFKYY